MRSIFLVLVLAGCGATIEGEDSSIPELEDEGAQAVTAPGGPVTEHRAFRVMTFNVRGPFDTGAHTWDRRRANVIARIRAHNPDVVGLQEVMVNSGEDMPKDLIAGLTSTYDHYRPGGTSSPKLIFFKRGRFVKLAQGSAPLPNPYANTSNVCEERSGNKKLAWVKLRDVLTNQQYFIGNTHLAFSEPCGLGRLRQAQEIKRVIDAQAGGLPVIVMGDFNTDPQKPALADEGVVEAMEEFGGRTLYRTARHDGDTDADTATFNSRWDGSGTNNARLDYIFHSGRVITSSAPAVDRWPGTDTGTPSDHLPVLATIRGATFEPNSSLVQGVDSEDARTQLFYADLDGDGCADQISWNFSSNGGDTFWAKSRCDGTFTAPVAHTNGGSAVATTRFYFADLTGDGCAEKIFWRPSFDDGQHRVYPSKCNGTFGPYVTVTDTPSESESTEFFFARINADRCADLVRWNPNQDDGRFRVHLADCNGSVGFGAVVRENDGASESARTQAWFADVNGDGRDDKILWHPEVAGGRTRVYRSVGNGTFAKLFEHTAGTSGSDRSRFYFADVDGDRRADKIFWRPDFRQGRMQIYPSSGANFAGSPTTDNTGFSGSEATRFFYADTDKSGAADKVYWNPGANGGAAKLFQSRQ
jgi:endonuclease/exonuclease/phosphatase family metal-dependent hydrolase